MLDLTGKSQIELMSMIENAGEELRFYYGEKDFSIPNLDQLISETEADIAQVNAALGTYDDEE